MVVQELLDSLSRCFGAPGPNISNGRNSIEGEADVVSSSAKAVNRRILNNFGLEIDDKEFVDARRRQGRALGLELQDQEWDALFSRSSDNATSNSLARQSRHGNDDTPVAANSSSSPHSQKSSSPSKASTPVKKELDVDMSYQEVLAKAKEASSTSHRTSTKKIKKSKSCIFRSKQNSANACLASRLLGKDGVKALCFANPVNDSPQAQVDDTSACYTHDTADDTTVSNLYLDQQQVADAAPPMPLFNRFKVECSENTDNALMTIVATGSHHTQNVRIYNQVQSDSYKTVVSPAFEENKQLIQKTPNTSRTTTRKKEKPRKLPLPISPKSTHTVHATPTKHNKDHDSIPPPMQRISGSNSTSISSQAGCI